MTAETKSPHWREATVPRPELLQQIPGWPSCFAIHSEPGKGGDSDHPGCITKTKPKTDMGYKTIPKTYTEKNCNSSMFCLLSATD